MHASVDTSERWRSWLLGGLTHVLGPLPWMDAFKQASDLELNVGVQTRAAHTAVAAQPVPGKLGGAATRHKARRGGVGADEDNPAEAVARPAEAPEAHTGGEERNLRRPLPVDSWPEAWKAAWAKTVFARPFLWSYERLGQDLMGMPSPARREALKKLLSRLSLGAAHNFWPFSEPAEQGGMCLQPDLFHEGLRLLAPKCVIFLGQDVFAGITLPEPPEPYKVVSYLGTGMLCVHLPDIQALGADDNLLAETAANFQQKLRHLI